MSINYEPAIEPVRSPAQRRRELIEAFTPKSLVCWREGYSLSKFMADLVAGLTVAIIALPLAMAFAINSGVTPDRGLYTAIIAGFVISLLGGSRVQVAGPTGAFVPILYSIVQVHGYEGLCIATVMAGIILILMGIARFGGMIKFIPYPVTTGFTSGIAVIIASQQVRDALGLNLDKIPSHFHEQLVAYYHTFSTFNPFAVGICLGSIAIMVLFRRFLPRIPGAIVAVVLAAVVVALFHLDVNHGVSTIASKFGSIPIPSGIPQTFPVPHLPPFSAQWIGQTLVKAMDLIPAATTIAFLASIESLLCCVVADGMIGGRHKSNLELVAQGLGNIASIFFGGIPATGAIARTAANVKNGGRTPVAGMLHAVFVLLAMLILAPYAGQIPMAVLAAVLLVVAWNMSEVDHFRSMFRAPRADQIVLLTTFGLTVFADLSIAVGVGIVLAAILFMKRMTEVTNVAAVRQEFDDTAQADDQEGDPNSLLKRDVPAGVEVYEINGPFFFGIADRLKDTLRGLERPPHVFILRMRRVDSVDATGIHALEEFYTKCKRQGTQLLLAGVHAQPMFALAKYGILDEVGEDNLFGNIDDALDRARQIIGSSPLPRPDTAEPEVARERK